MKTQRQRTAMQRYGGWLIAKRITNPTKTQTRHP
jgi:hypothetical protein